MAVFTLVWYSNCGATVVIQCQYFCCRVCEIQASYCKVLQIVVCICLNTDNTVCLCWPRVCSMPAEWRPRALESHPKHSLWLHSPAWTWCHRRCDLFQRAQYTHCSNGRFSGEPRLVTCPGLDFLWTLNLCIRWGGPKLFIPSLTSSHVFLRHPVYPSLSASINVQHLIQSVSSLSSVWPDRLSFLVTKLIWSNSSLMLGIFPLCHSKPTHLFDHTCFISIHLYTLLHVTRGVLFSFNENALPANIGKILTNLFLCMKNSGLCR